MKHTFLYLALLTLAPLFMACSDESDLEPSAIELPVTNHNISGTWHVSSWRGQPLAGNAYVHITFVRRDQLFTIKQNLGSMYEQTFTGKYRLKQDDDTEQWILSGSYDYDGGEWAHEYYITAFNSTTLTLTATDDPADVTIYTRQQ